MNWKLVLQLSLFGVIMAVGTVFWISSTAEALFWLVANHAREAAMIASAPLPPRLMMLAIGPAIGVVSGVVMGLLSLLATKLVSRPTRQPNPTS